MKIEAIELHFSFGMFPYTFYTESILWGIAPYLRAEILRLSKGTVEGLQFMMLNEVEVRYNGWEFVVCSYGVEVNKEVWDVELMLICMGKEVGLRWEFQRGHAFLVDKFGCRDDSV
jgi:hypothetical protein